MFEMLYDGFASVLNPYTIFLIMAGVGVGIIFGAIPGMTANMAVALCIPVTFGMTATQGIALLCGLYIGGISGGLITAILLNIPGTPASIATTFDGHPMAINGEAGKALGAGILFSFFGSLIGIFLLIFISPPLATITIRFGPVEYFAAAIFSMTMVISLSGKSLLKGCISACIGMSLALVGLAPIDSVQRYTFGNPQLVSGFKLLTVAIGMFAISELLVAAENKLKSSISSNDFASYNLKWFGVSLREIKEQTWNCLRSGLIGTGIGILPGIGGGVSNMVAYTTAKNQSKTPEKFGNGILDGIVASETANNATIGGAMIPLLTLGIPGDAVTAMMLGGFMLHGITPGPLLFKTSGVFVYGIFASLLIANVAMLIIERSGIKAFIKLVQTPSYILFPVIVTLCAVGAFGLNNRIFDVQCFAVFGLLGYILRKIDLPKTPVTLGFILGPMVELNLRRSMQLVRGNVFEFFNHPIAVGFFIVTLISLIYSIRTNRKVDKMLFNK